MTPPAWARALLAEVCADARVAMPRLSWRRRDDEHSTGVMRRSDDLVAVRVGRDPVDQRLTLLHELAHWLAATSRRGRRAIHHGRAFYSIAFELYRRHGIADEDALRLEAGRYPSSLRHAAALGVPGAAEALARRRSAMRARPRRQWRVLVPEHSIRLAREGRWTVCTTCGQRLVGVHLARLRRARRSYRHVLMTSEELAS